MFYLQTEPESKAVQGEEDLVSQNELEALMSGQHPKEEAGVSDHGLGPGAAVLNVVPGKWVCAQSSQSKSSNFNKHITDKLEVLAKAYTHQGDKWRALSYSKAVNALKSYHKPVTSYQVSAISTNYQVYSGGGPHGADLSRWTKLKCFRRLVRSQESERAWLIKLTRSWRAVICGSSTTSGRPCPCWSFLATSGGPERRLHNCGTSR